MNLIRYLNNLTPFADGCAVTIGNFDGVHLGHQAVFKQLQEVAAALKLPLVVMTFDPSPQEFFSQDPPARLTRLREKLCYFSECKLRNIICLRFNKALEQLSAEDFVKDILIKKLNMKHLIVGEDFRFGYKRQGDYELLQTLAQRYGFGLSKAIVINDSKGERISSTRVRSLLAAGQFAEANALLGHPYVMIGRVVHGEKLGRTLGFPTANIELQRRKSPLQGIFAVRVHGLNARVYLGVVSLGTRPAVNGKKMLLEVYFFDFDQEIYGKLLKIEFCHKLRDERHFESLALLTEQIAKDVVNAKEYFSRHPRIREDDGEEAKRAGGFFLVLRA